MVKKPKERTLSKDGFIPVVTLLGHVDHGKTSLLDTIRSTNIVAREFGGITQHIGAYQISHHNQKITFIDTPGHAAFEKMRSRGANVCDIAVLVIAADDGVKPQTVEAVKHIKNAQVPIIVAINKIDLSNADVPKIKGQLAKEGIEIEEQGGEVPVVLVSAKTGQGLADLLDMILLVSQLTEKTSDKDASLESVVIESYLDKARGPVVHLIVKTGTLGVGDEVKVDGVEGKVRAMIDDLGKMVSKAGPSTPVEVLGIKKPVEMGAILKKTGVKKSTPVLEEENVSVSPLSLLARREEIKRKLKIILKTDVSGSKEAILENLPDEIHVVSASTGEISDFDILHAKASQAIIYGFNVKVKGNVQKQADQEGVKIKIFNVIYKFFEDLDEELARLEAAKEESQILGRAKIIAQFEIEGQKVAGCRVTSGELSLEKTVRLLRDGKIIGQAKIKSLKQKKINVEKVTKGIECGVTFLPELDFTVGDALELLPL